MKFIKKLFGILPLRYASAHCDVPCGIYDPSPMLIAAKTVLVMVQKIKQLEKPEKGERDEWLNYKNSITRMIMTKEHHAQICKQELLILWTDYFKPEHLEKFNDLHDVFWKAAKLCSQNKQHIDEELAQDLVDSTNHISEIFQQSK